MRKLFLLISLLFILITLFACSAGADTKTPGNPVQSVSAAASPETSQSITSPVITYPPGYRTMEDVKRNFISLLEDKKIPELLTYTEMKEQDLEWLYDDSMPVNVTDAAGFEFSNGDIVILFMTETPEEDANTLNENIKALASGHFASDSTFARIVCDDYGFMGCSKSYGSELSSMAEFARQF